MFQERTKYLQSLEASISKHKAKFQEMLKKAGWKTLKIHSNEDDKNQNTKESLPSSSELTDDPNNTGINVSVPELVDFSENFGNFNSTKQKSATEVMLERIEMERNLKRRRISYKNKVHTKNKSHTEVLREVVQQQMEALKGLAEDNKIPIEKKLEYDLIELRPTEGNPHLYWQIALDTKNSHERSNSKERIISPREHRHKIRKNRSPDEKNGKHKKKKKKKSRSPQSSHSHKHKHKRKH